MQMTAQKTLNCTHCALRTTLVVAHSFTTETLWQTFAVLEAWLRRSGHLPTRSAQLTGVKCRTGFTQYILIAMALGIVMGTLVFNYLPDSRAEIAADVNLIAMLFLRLIKMIIAPLVFATLVGGIAHMGSGSKLGRIFAKTMGWFVSASFISLLLRR